MQILSSGDDIYITDKRYHLEHWENEKMNTSNYILVINNLSVGDSGHFECQLNSEPPVSYIINLSVVKTHVDIIGDADLYIQLHTSLKLPCIVTNIPHEGIDVIWRKNGIVLEGDNIQTVKSVKTIESILDIGSVSASSSGEYVCSTSREDVKDHLHLHVLLGDWTEELQVPSFASHSYSELHFSLLVSIIISSYPSNVQ